jgi:hypothetical protein
MDLAEVTEFLVRMKADDFSNFTWDFNRIIIQSHFAHAPTGISCHFHPNGKFRGSVTVQYSSVETATSVLEQFDNVQIKGQHIRAQYYRNNPHSGEIIFIFYVIFFSNIE